MKAGNWNGTGRQGNWELIDTCSTMEIARDAVKQLTARGIESEITMINGLCVIAQVKAPPATK